jgi:CheY-like chemotaxis protein
MMPGMDGWAVLTTLKKDPDLCDIPVLMCTMLDDRNLGFSLGASEFLAKPIDRNRLTTILRKYGQGPAPGQVLLVEDDAATREMMTRMLHKEGWAVAEAENGLVALARVAAHRPDLILLDLMMPQMDGRAQEFRKVEAYRYPHCVLTAKDLTADDHRRLSGQVESILQKGTRSGEDLVREMGDLLKRSLRPQKAAKS